MIFLFVWTTIVYDFIAYWTWGYSGWLKSMGALDFAGGGPVHISSGFAALAYAAALGPRRRLDFKRCRPSNMGFVYLGTALLWFGWFGFNGGSEGAVNARSVNAVVVTNLAASVAGLTWMLLDMCIQQTRHMSLNNFCAGAVTGLVAITPACGFVWPYSSLAIGFIAAVIGYFAARVKALFRHRFDDACDVWAVHGIGGAVGSLLTAFFAQKSVVDMVGDAKINGGFLDGNVSERGGKAGVRGHYFLGNS